MNIGKKKVVTFTLILIIAALSIYIIFFRQNSLQPEPLPSQAGKINTLNIHSKNDNFVKQKNKSVTTLADYDTKSILRGDDKNKWVTAYKFLSNLPLSDLWDILDAPGISDQLQSKAARQQLLRACIPALKKKGNAPLMATQSLVDVACSDLAKVGDATYFTNEYMKLSADKDFQVADYKIPIPEIKLLTPSQFEQEWELAKSQLTQSSDPYLAGSAIRHMWWTQSPDIYNDWSEINALSASQRDQLMQVIATDASCAMIGGCSQNSAWLISLCTIVPGMICPSGKSYEEIVDLNLSQYQLLLRQKILTTLPPRG